MMMLGSDVEGTSSEQWLTQLPAILIVTSSMVIDRSLRKDLIEERVRCQIWLWFCVILSLRSHPISSRINNDKDYIIHSSTDTLICETWMHLIIVSNLASIGALAISGPLERIKKSKRGSWWFSFAAWTAMMSSSCLFAPLRYAEGTQESSIAMFSLQVYAISFCILAMIHWHKRRRERMEQEMRKITNYGGSTNNPSSSSFVLSQDMDGFDRSKWYTWKASTTLQWISHVLDDNDDVDHGVLQQLASHRIDGSLLDTLTVSQLLQLQVPYGPACHLDQAIQTELVRPFPKPRGADDVRNDASFRGGTTTPAAAQSDFLSGFDQEYNNSDRPRNLASNSSNSKNEKTPSGLADRNSFASGPEMLDLDPNQADRIQDVMKEKYGLELPRLRTEGASEPDSSTSQSNSVTDGEHPLQQAAPMQKKPPPSALPTPKEVPVAAAMPNLASAAAAGGEIPEVILKQMPANIQDIAKRRPDVVRQLLFSKQQKLQEQQHLQQQQQQQQQQQFQREDNLYTHAEEGEYIHEVGNDDSNDETSRLIRRKKDHREYKSTGL